MILSDSFLTTYVATPDTLVTAGNLSEEMTDAAVEATIRWSHLLRDEVASTLSIADPNNTLVSVVGSVTGLAPLTRGTVMAVRISLVLFYETLSDFFTNFPLNDTIIHSENKLSHISRTTPWFIFL